jgi:hypothetical protein
MDMVKAQPATKGGVGIPGGRNRALPAAQAPFKPPT